MEGLIIKTTGSWYTVRLEDGSAVDCRIKGNFRIKGIKSTNPIAIGDRVVFEMQPKENIGLISEIKNRHNCIVRKSVNLSKQTHIIAANVDIAFLIVSMFNPRTPLGFIDRFLVNAEAYCIPTIIVFNKIDSYDEESKILHEETKSIYEKIGYKCIDTSALLSINIEQIKEQMKNKICLMSGNSGVGKSLLTNKIDSSLNIKIGDVSNVHHKGKHTTTFAEMHETSFGAFIIDTPGIKEFGMVDLKKEEIALFFPEMRMLANKCQFDNCTHEHEPKCAVKLAVENGSISLQRYKSYLNIMNGKEMDIQAWETK